MKKEQPYYYSTTIENGEIVHHEGDPAHAVYKSDIAQTQQRANAYHVWIDENYTNAFDSLGVLDEDIYAETSKVREQFMRGLRNA